MVINVLQSLVKTASIGLLRGLYTQILANRMAHDAEVSNHTVVRHFAQALQQAVGDTSYARAHGTFMELVADTAGVDPMGGSLSPRFLRYSEPERAATGTLCLLIRFTCRILVFASFHILPCLSLNV